MSTLKKENALPLLAALVAHALIFWAVLTGEWEFRADDPNHLLSNLAKTSSITAVLGVVVFLLQGLVSSDVKARLIFWRFRGNPYPGAEAFSRWMYCDPRIDPQIITERFGPLPIEGNAQNSLWYKLLKSHESKSSIIDAHRRYLLARDLMANCILFGFPAAIAVWWGQSLVWLNVVFVCGTIGAVFVMAIAARNHGIRLVTSVLAAESSDTQGDTNG